ncbi:MAG: undecaprenyl-phosphate glucose phosphotransferase [Bacteroidota bacterium]
MRRELHPNYASSYSLYRLFTLIVDYFLVDLACKLSYFLKFGRDGNYEDYYVSFFIIFGLAWIGASLFNDIYKAENIFKFKTLLANLFYTLLTHAFIMMLCIVTFKAFYFSRAFLLYSYGFTLAFIIGFRFIMIMVYRYRESPNNKYKVAIVGDSLPAKGLNKHFNEKNATVYNFTDMLDGSLNSQNPEDRKSIFKKLKEVQEFILQEGIHEIYYALPFTDMAMVDELSDFADNNFLYFRIATDFHGLESRNLNVDLYGHVPVLTFRTEPLRFRLNRVIKRAFDIAFSSLVLVTIFPILFVVISIAIKLNSPGPVIFAQTRHGRKNRKFTCYKFRTMTFSKNASFVQATKNDNRITKVGAFLRKTNLDEFPQFINVFLGHMSIVGPRPHPIKLDEEFSQKIDKYLFRHFTTPGITGHAQVNGYRGNTEDPSMMVKRVEHDTWYIENWSFYLDLKIIFFTVWNMVRGEENAF